VLRATKNRYGATHEVGLFEMRDSGLVEVPDAAKLWLEERDEAVSGTAALCTMEGSRPLVLEVQALVAPSPFAAPRRVAGGLDLARLHLLLAVLEQRGGTRLGQRDVYVNVAGGVRVCEPAADLAVVMAVASAATGTPLPSGTIMFGEVGLTGEVRRVAHTGLRLAEAARLGFTRAVLPRPARGGGESAAGLEQVAVRTVREALGQLGRGAAMGAVGSE
jgi:DNA repair protein RadA/Sms